MRSQTYVLALTVTGSVCLFIGLLFVWFDRGYLGASIAFVGAISLFVLGYRCWRISRRDIDLHGGHPTIIKYGDAGFEISTDSRSSESISTNEVLDRVIAHRTQELEPTATVRFDGVSLDESATKLFSGSAEILLLQKIRKFPEGIFAPQLARLVKPKLSRNRLYFSLGWLEGRGLIDSVEASQRGLGGLPRRYYKITGAGSRAVATGETNVSMRRAIDV